MGARRSIASSAAAGLLALTATPMAAQDEQQDAADRVPAGILTLEVVLDGRSRPLDKLVKVAVDTARVGYEGGETALDEVVVDALVIPGPNWEPESTWESGTTWVPGDAWIPGTAWQQGSTWEPGVAWQPASAWSPGASWQAGSTWNPDSTWLQGSLEVPGDTWQPHSEWTPGSTWIAGETWLPDDGWLGADTVTSAHERCIGSDAVLLVTARAADLETAGQVGANVAAVCLDRRTDVEVVPTPGRWTAVEVEQRAECKTPLDLEANPDLAGEVLVSLDGVRIGADDLVPGAQGRVKLQRTDANPPDYRGSSTGKELGKKARLAIVWEIIDERAMFGTVKARFKVAGKPCFVVRTFALALETPG